MFYYKKVLVLKRTGNGIYDDIRNMSGIVRLETENNLSELHLSLINLPLVYKGTYYAFFIDSANNNFSFPLGSRPISLYKTFPYSPDTSRGFATGIFLLKDNIPLTLLFAETDDYNMTIQDFKKSVNNYCLDKFKESNQPDDEPVIVNESQFIQDTTRYDDEAVATENYYLYEDEEGEKNDSATENVNAYKERKEKASQSEENNRRIKDEADFNIKTELTQGPAYYEGVKEELSSLFEKFPVEENLSKIIPDSKWVKIQYSQNKYYVVGLVREEKKEKYICYGVPSVYSPEAPEILKGYSSFIPLSIFDLHGKGYWIMFQSADNGKCVHLSKA